jgi:hypothetical protein
MNLTPQLTIDLTEIIKAYLVRFGAVKTLEQYLRQLRQYSRDYYNGKTDDSQFLDSMIGAVDNQFNRAWNEGMRDNGLDPATDKTDDDRKRVKELVDNETNFITNLSDLINTQRGKDGGLDVVYNRVDTWASNYNGVRQIAKTETARDRLKWILGPTEEHCPSCSKLNGLVYPAKEWADRGVYPQVNGAEYLNCHGFNCLCELIQTKEPVTKEPFPSLP